MFDLFYDVATDYTFRMVALGCTLLGVVSGVLGCFAVLRRQSLLGDMVSHAALPGIVLAYMLTSSKQPIVLMLGAAAAGWLAALTSLAITRTTRIKPDTALAVCLAVFFGTGDLLYTWIRAERPDSAQAGLGHFFYGQTASIMSEDVLAIAGLGGVALVILMLLWKELKLLSFDPEYGAALGWPMRGLDVLLTTLLVIAIVVGLQTVGVVLMSALLVAPAAAARQWTDRLGVLIVLAGVFGALSGLIGGVIASPIRHLPAGPVIVLVAAGFVVLSILLAPNRGLLWHGYRHWLNRRRLAIEAVLADLQVLAEQHPGQEHGHPLAVLRAMSVGRAGLERSLAELTERGWARQVQPGSWALTPAGREAAEQQAHERGKPE